MGREKIYIEASTHELYKELTEAQGDLRRTPFRTMKDMFLWAACLGCKKGVPRPIKEKKDIFGWSIFSESTDIPLLKAIAISAKKDISIVLRQEDILKIAEEYANAGVGELYSSLTESGNFPLMHLVDLLPESEID